MVALGVRCLRGTTWVTSDSPMAGWVRFRGVEASIVSSRTPPSRGMKQSGSRSTVAMRPGNRCCPGREDGQWQPSSRLRKSRSLPPSEGCRQAASPRHDLQRFDPQRSRLTDNENAARVIRDWRHFPHRVRRNRHGRRVSPLVLAAINHLLRRAGWLPPAGAHLMQRSNRGRPLRHSGCPFGLVHPVRRLSVIPEVLGLSHGRR